MGDDDDDDGGGGDGSVGNMAFTFETNTISALFQADKQQTP